MATWQQYYQGTSGGLYGSTPAVVTPADVKAGTGYISSTGVSSTGTTGTWGQYYQGLSGGLYGSTPVVGGASSTSGDTGTSGGAPKPVEIPGTSTPTGNISTAGYTAPTTVTEATNATLNTGATVLSETDKARQDLLILMQDRLKRYGLETLYDKIRQLAIEGATEATITLQLQETPEYQARFKANADRIRNNLQVLTPAEYLSVEDTYRQVLRSYGLTQFSTDDYVSQFISNDVSPTELNNRVQIAVNRIQNADPAVSSTLRDYYGLSDTDLIAYALDPDTQYSKIQKQIQSAEIGAAARAQGINATLTTAEQLALQGVTQAEAQKGYATIADILPTAEKLSQIYGTTLEG